MMKVITPTELRNNLYRLLDEILLSGIPIEINKRGKRLRIVPVEIQDKLQNLVKRPDFIVGNPDDLIHMDWEKEISLDLP